MKLLSSHAWASWHCSTHALLGTMCKSCLQPQLQPAACLSHRWHEYVYIWWNHSLDLWIPYLRRSSSSSIPIDNHETFELQKLVKKHPIQERPQAFSTASRGVSMVSSWCSRVGSFPILLSLGCPDWLLSGSRFVNEMQRAVSNAKTNESTTFTKRVSVKSKAAASAFCYPVVLPRDLDIANASTRLARFNAIMRRCQRTTLVDEMFY